MKAIADRFAEASAEYVHKLMRDACGYGKDENLTNEELIKEKYRGIRPAPGYPACPEHRHKRQIFKQLDVEASIGLSLTENCAMWPASAVSGFYFTHPESRYFSLGKISKDQVESYAKRVGEDIELSEKWLAPNLGY